MDEFVSVYWASDLAERAVRALGTLRTCGCVSSDADSGLVDDVAALERVGAESEALWCVKRVASDALESCLTDKAKCCCPAALYELLAVYWSVDE